MTIKLIDLNINNVNDVLLHSIYLFIIYVS